MWPKGEQPSVCPLSAGFTRNTSPQPVTLKEADLTVIFFFLWCYTFKIYSSGISFLFIYLTIYDFTWWLLLLCVFSSFSQAGLVFS